MTAVPANPTVWSELEAFALEKGMLDGVDLALIGSLMSATRSETGAAAESATGVTSDVASDAAFPSVIGALITAVRSGSIRIPLHTERLAAHLEEFLKGILPAPSVLDPDILVDPGSIWTSGSFDCEKFARDLAARFSEALRAGTYDAVVGNPGGFFPLIRTEGGLYFQKYHAAEALAGARLHALLAAPDLDLSGAAIQELLGTVLDLRPLRLSQAPDAPAMEFDPRQKEALALAIRKRFTVISGGPGTGKTSLAANLLRAWTRAWIGLHGTAPRIRLAAPTGRAAQRLSESIRRSLESVRRGSPESGSGADPASDPGNPANPGMAADLRVRELECATLHSLLRYNPGTGGYGHNAHRPLPADLILIDEVSMVDIFTLARVLDAMETGAGLILLGDMDQLPSVEAGSVLADLVPRPGDPAHPLRDNLIALDRSHRSSARILEVTRCINAKQGPEAIAAMGTPLSLGSGNVFGFNAADESNAANAANAAEAFGTEGGCRMLLPAKAVAGEIPAQASGLGASPASYRTGWPAWLDAWIDFHYLSPPPGRAAYSDLIADLCSLPSPEDPRRDGLLNEVFTYLDQARILTFTRKGWHGAVNINRRIRERIGRRWDPRASKTGSRVGAAVDSRAGAATGSGEGDGGFAGSPLLILENDPGKGLFNGDVGIQVRIQGRDLAFFRRGEAFLGFAAAFLPRHETAFAMTIHKSQGSEYDYALVVLPESGNRLLYKETLYTALTRARRFAGIYGPEPVFLEAVARHVVRESGLAESLGALRR